MTLESDGYTGLSNQYTSSVFENDFGGPFSTQLEINVKNIETSLKIAGLSGRLVLKERSVRGKSTIPEINSDGSITLANVARGAERMILDFSDKVFGQHEKLPYYDVQPDHEGWTLYLDGNLIRDDMSNKTGKNIRGIEDEVAREYSNCIKSGLQSAFFKDRINSEKDPYWIARISSTFLLCFIIPNIFTHPGNLGRYLFARGTANLLIPLIHKKMSSSDELQKSKFYSTIKDFAGLYDDPQLGLEEFINTQRYFLKSILFQIVHRRKPVHNLYDVFLAPPWGVDRSLLAYGYLQRMVSKEHPLIRKVQSSKESPVQN